MIKVNLNDIYKEKAESGLKDYFENTEFGANEEYEFVFPEDIDFSSSLYDTIYKTIVYSNVKVLLKEYKGGMYFSGNNTDYLYLFKACPGSEYVEVPETVKRIEQRAFHESSTEHVVILAKRIVVGHEAFIHAEELKSVAFENNEYVRLCWQCFAYTVNLSNVTFSDGEFIFEERLFNCDRIEHFILPRKATFSERCLEIGFLKSIFIPKEHHDVSPLHLLSGVEVYCEGDGNKVLLNKEVDKTVETAEDYGHNFHSSSGSFSYTHIHEDPIYASKGNHHSFVSLEDYKKKYGLK